MKKTFTEPEISVTNFSVEDIITGSVVDPEIDRPDCLVELPEA